MLTAGAANEKCDNEKCATSAQGDWPIRKRILLKEQSQPRHNDLTPVFR
jgi:hypothetical protein